MTKNTLDPHSNCSVSLVRDLCRTAEELHNAGRFTEALTAAEQAVVSCARSLGRAHYAYPLALCTLGWLRHSVGEAATAVFAEAVALARTLAEDDFEHAVVVISQAADFARETAQPQRYGELGTELVDLHLRHLGPDHPRTHQLAAKLVRLHAAL
ncbi:MAG: hypothetical protein FJ146_14095 [Deltaproteobacteria bacterium]|nr:hypothetical protein [Deltaproteobacteria bacterium]